MFGDDQNKSWKNKNDKLKVEIVGHVFFGFAAFDLSYEGL
jgi:hypothetical protein